jgi:hypothetical protein
VTSMAREAVAATLTLATLLPVSLHAREVGRPPDSPPPAVDEKITRRFVAEHQLEGRWAMIPDWGLVALIGVRATPTAYVLDSDRVFLKRVTLSNLDLPDRCTS